MSHAEQLERETEQTRTQIANTLDELRARMTPGNIVDELASRLSDGATGAFARNLKDQTVNNPLPVALIGAGLAWLMLGPRGSSDGGLMSRAADRLGEAASRAADKVRSTSDAASGSAADKGAEWSDKVSGLSREAAARASSTTEDAKQGATAAWERVRDTSASMTQAAEETAAQTANATRDTAASTADAVQRAGSAGYDTITDSARRTASTVGASTKAVGQRTLDAGGSLFDFCREQPLMLVGLGIAAGALIGALLPSTKPEDEMMGETSDHLKERATDVASQQYQSAKKIGERAVGAARDEAAKQASKVEKGESKEGAPRRVRAEEATLEPLQGSGESLGQPWTAENAPL